MDPNVALAKIRESIANLMDSDDDGTIDSSSQLGQLIESFDGLDQWLSKGGFFPRAWVATQWPPSPDVTPVTSHG